VYVMGYYSSLNVSEQCLSMTKAYNLWICRREVVHSLLSTCVSLNINHQISRFLIVDKPLSTNAERYFLFLEFIGEGPSWKIHSFYDICITMFYISINDCPSGAKDWEWLAQCELLSMIHDLILTMITHLDETI